VGKEGLKTGIFSHINQDLARETREVVLKIVAAGRTARQALEIARTALAWADELMARNEADPPLERPIACQTACHYCCFNQVEITPPEALAIGEYVERTFTPEEKARLMQELDRAITFKSGKSKLAIAALRQELRCPLLRDGRCAVYEVRPLICRAMHSLDVAQCERAFRLASNTGVEHHAHRDEIVGSILTGLLEGCRDLGCQAEPLDLARALRDFFETPSPLERWMAGEEIFSPLNYPET
jgi:Fe-S-cluster containining protein